MRCEDALKQPAPDAPDLPIVLVAAAALVNKQGEVLIAQRPEGKSMAGLWEFPGGWHRNTSMLFLANRFCLT